MKFGVYIGSVAGTDKDLAVGRPDDPSSIHKVLDELESSGVPVIIRGYIHYSGEGQLGYDAPVNIIQYSSTTRKIDLVLCYRSTKYDKADWTSTVKKVIQQYGDTLCCIQITEEPNLKGVFSGDGSFEHINKVLKDGVLAARQEVSALGYPVKIGFNTVLSFDPQDTFWNVIGGDDYRSFREAIDYVGLDFFPDVFRPLPTEGFPGNLTGAVKHVLAHFRNVNLNIGKIPASVPIHITENGWSTSGGKSPEKQAIIIETIVRALESSKSELNITHYELFSLRDTDSDNDNVFYQFGLLKDDYSPKPAFHTFCKLIKELGEK